MKLYKTAIFFLITIFISPYGWCEQDTCAVLTNSPLVPDSYNTVKHILEEYLNCYVKEISLENDEIAAADLSNIKLLYCAGGPYLDYHPSAAAANNIRRAVARGMGYFGTCGGALIAVAYTPSSRENQFSIFPGYHPFGSGKGMRAYDMNLLHPIITNSSVANSFSERDSIHYNGGGSDFCPYVPGLVNWVIAKDVIRNTPALTCTMYGKGRVFLSVAHPERSYIPSTWKFVRLAAEWCLGRSEPEVNNVPIIHAHIPYSAPVNQAVIFMANGSDDPEGYPIGFIWDFGDGTGAAYDPVVTHIYSAPGKYKVTLTVTDGVKENVIAQEVNIKAM
jgi:hypothetical protein